MNDLIGKLEPTVNIVGVIANGIQGVQGVPGIAGIDGTAGAQGVQGIQGEAGLPGSAVYKGDTGLTGIQGIPGVQGVIGVPGIQGVQGLQGETGTIVVNWKGEWNSETGYIIDDGITWEGTSYVALQTSTNQVPPNATYWQLIAAAGIQGPQGIQGGQGTIGNTGAQGIQGIQGIKGDTGLTGVYTVVTTSVNGLMSSTDKSVLDRLASLSTDGELVVHVATSDSGSVGSTRVNIINAELGVNYIQALDTLGNTTFSLFKNYTYSVVLLDYPSSYGGGSTNVTVTESTQAVTITLNTQLNIVGWRMKVATGAVEYTDASSSYTPATMGTTFDSGSWAQSWLFKNIKPCMLKAGIVQYYLNPDDYTKKADGTAADITSGIDGDVMIEFPMVYYKFYSETDVDSVSWIGCRFSLTLPDGTYCANAFLSQTAVIQNTMYMSAYEGYSLSSKLRSLSGKTPTASQTIGAFRTLATANGTGYQQQEWSKRVLLQAMFVMMFKGLDSQTLLGQGVTSASAKINTGTMNTKGMYWGDQTAANGVKFCGIENFWGNIYKFCDGLELVTNVYKYKIYAPYNDTASSYLDSAKSAPTGNYIQSMNSGNGYGMIPATTASAGIFADYINTTTSGVCICYTGGGWSGAAFLGAFCVFLSAAASYTVVDIGTALSFTPQ